MSKFAGFVIGAIEIGIGAATGNVALIVQGGLTIVAQAIVDLTAPKTPAREASEMTIKLGEQPRVMQIGETYTPGSLVDVFDYGGKYGTDWEVLVIRLADHKCHSLSGFYVNDDYVPYTGDGSVARYKGQLVLYFRADTSTDPLPAIVTAHGPGWTAADIGRSGCDVIVAYKADKPNAKKPVWPGGRPHFGFVLKGKFQYDRRKDDTVPGGSGPHRWTDPSTWEWSENAIVCWDNFERGIFADDDVDDPAMLLVGRGLSAEELAPDDLVIAAANLCDEQDGVIFGFNTRATVLTLANAVFSPDGARMLIQDNTAAFELWNLGTRSIMASGSLPFAVTGDGPGIASDGTIWSAGGGIISTTLYSFRPDGRLLGGIAAAIPFAGTAGVRVVGPADVVFVKKTTTGYGYYDPGTGSVFSVGLAFTVHSYIWDGANIWLCGNSGATLYFYCHSGPRAAELHSLASPIGSSSALVACNPGAGKFVCYQAGSWFLVSDTLWTASAAVALGTASPGDEFERVAVGAASMWVGWSEVSFTGPALIRSVVSTDWAPGDTFRPLYDRINHAIITDGGGAELMWRFLDQHGGYRVAGPIYANQPYIDVEKMFEAATAGSILTREGAVFIEPGQAKSVVATFTDKDLFVGSKVSWNRGFLSESSDEWLNTVVGTYVEPDQKWNSHATPPQRVGADIVADGKPREAQIPLRLVRYLPQALRIAEVARRKGRLWGRGMVTLPPRFCELEDGDWVQWQSDRQFAGGTKTLRVRSYSIDEKWQNTLSLEEIAANVFTADGTFAVDHSQPVTTPPPIDVGAPAGGDWALAATTLVSAGASVPALAITGATPAAENAEEIVVEYWKSDGVTDPVASPDAVPWIAYGRYTPGTTKIDITGLTGGGTYYVAISYVVSGIAGDRRVLGPATIADLDVSGQVGPLLNASPWKLSVRAKTTAALPANTYANGSSGVGATLTGTANGALAAQDGVTLVAGDRLLVANEAAAARNGVYALTQVGDGAHPYILTRATDADSAAELVAATVKVSEGTVSADNEWQCTTNAPIIVGTTGLTWTGGAALLAANNLSDVASAPTARGNLGLGSVATATLDTDGTLAANSDTSVASQKAVRTYIAAKLVGMFDLRGSTDCSANPNYPAASKGDAYIVTVAGKIGGAAGTTVAVGDVYFATADNAGGTQAAVGASWDVVIHAGSLAGALLAANNLSELASAATARTNLGLLRLVALFFTTTPTASEVLGLYIATDAFTLAANLAGSQVSVGTNPAATFAIDVQKAGTTIATISISTGGVVTLTTVSGTSKAIAAGDVIKFVAPGTADTTIANVAIALKGTL